MQTANALVDVPASFAFYAVFESIWDLYQFAYKQFRKHHMFLPIVELVDSTPNCFSIKGIYENTTSRLLVPFFRGGEAATATTGMLSESGDCQLGDSYTCGTLLPNT